jgi:hypothetical protein
MRIREKLHQGDARVHIVTLHAAAAAPARLYPDNRVASLHFHDILN